ncbi:hypothetical protein B0T20DRAFT_475852 [Sordaria brevicollis]|uniref:Uncharacterized protein n=1 Tax=Sordaria brevicollis TaxID=83679 RepID=A0AAE0PKX8_SORBR|nr:hypothetical protein B0T20DRAFT_475852 [Sordaria brevicollis]
MATQVHSNIVAALDNIMQQFNTPIPSDGLLKKLTGNQLKAATATVEWSTYHKMTDAHRQQLETLFEIVHALDETSCGGWQPKPGEWSTRTEILKSILLSLASLIFVRTSTTITMGTYGAESLAKEQKKQMGAQLVAKEGVESLKADCDLIIKLVTKLTESPPAKKF